MQKDERNRLIRSTPEDQGVASGYSKYVIAEGWWAPYKAEYPHEAYSLTKSFTSAARLA